MDRLCPHKLFIHIYIKLCLEFSIKLYTYTTPLSMNYLKQQFNKKNFTLNIFMSLKREMSNIIINYITVTTATSMINKLEYNIYKMNCYDYSIYFILN